MKKNDQPKQYEVVIIGGSHAGLSTGIMLGRSLRNVLIVDSSQPRNRFASEAHGIYTRDAGQSSLELIQVAREQMKKYDTLYYQNDIVRHLEQKEDHFEVIVKDELIETKKVVLATGITDVLPDIPGFSDLWGKQIIHCPYCSGWEIKESEVAVYVQGFEMAQAMLTAFNHWFQVKVLYTDGESFTSEEIQTLEKSNVEVIQSPIDHVKSGGKGIIVESGHQEKNFRSLVFASLSALSYNNDLANRLGCELHENGAVKVDEKQETTVPGVYAVGDLIAMPIFQKVPNAMATGSLAGIAINTALLGF